MASPCINQSVSRTRSLNVTVLSLAVSFFGNATSSSDNKLVADDRIITASSASLDEQSQLQSAKPEERQTNFLKTDTRNESEQFFIRQLPLKYSPHVKDGNPLKERPDRLTEGSLKEVRSAEKLYLNFQKAVEQLQHIPGGEVLTTGSRGESVENLQQLLKKTITPELVIDGIYGRDTEAAVKKFQHLMNGLHLEESISVDGVFGPESYQALSECCSDGIFGAYRLSQVVAANVRLPAEDRTASFTCYELIKHYEGFRAEAYQDSAGIWTTGYGHTGNVRPGEEVTAEEAEVLLVSDVSRAETAVRRLVKVPLRQHEFDALVDFCFNLGEGNLARSTLLNELNSGNYEAVVRELPKWCLCSRNGKKIKLQGLFDRRMSELKLWQTESSCSLSDCLK